jgi:hypothetical protein
MCYCRPYHTLNKSLVLEWPTFIDVYSFTVTYRNLKSSIRICIWTEPFQIRSTALVSLENENCLCFFCFTLLLLAVGMVHEKEKLTQVSNFETLSLAGIFSRYLWFWVWKLNGARAICSLTQERAYRQIWRLGTNKLQY